MNSNFDKNFYDTLSIKLENPADSLTERFVLAVSGVYLSSGGKVWDIGANHGQHTKVLGSRIGNSGKILIIEADPLLASKLVEASKISDIDIQVLNAAVSGNQSNNLIFYRHKNKDQEGSIIIRENSDQYDEILVKNVTLDALSKDFFNPDFIKMDIEGAEFDAITSSKTFVKNLNALVAIELSFNVEDYCFFEFLNFLNNNRCDLYTLSGKIVDSERLRSFSDTNFCYQWWIAKRKSKACEFLNFEVPKYAEIFTWAVSKKLDYPYHLFEHPIVFE